MTAAKVLIVDEGHWAISGELNFDSVPGIWRKMSILFKTPHSLILDLTDVSRSDSAGLALMIEWMREARKIGKPISFENMPDQMSAVARSCGVEELLPR